MDTPPLAAAIHKENVLFIGGEKATVKTAAGKKRKASADLRSTYVPVAGASKDVDLKHKSSMKGNKIKKNQMTRGKRHAAAAILITKNPYHKLTDEEILQFCEWSDHVFTDESDYFMMRKESILRKRMRAAAADHTIKKPNHILTDEKILTDKEIRDYYECSDHILTDEKILTDEEIRDYYECSDHILTDEEIKKFRKRIEDTDREFCMRMESLQREPISKLKPPSLSGEDGCKTDDSDFECFKSVPGPYYTPEELDDPFDDFEKLMEEIMFEELMSDDD